MSTDLERRLRETFDEMIPQLIEQIGVVDVVDAAPLRPRRWVAVGALAVAASVVALAWGVGVDALVAAIPGVAVRDVCTA